MPLLEVQNLRKHYGSQQALQDITFQVAEGEMFGLLGPNGAGKTTLLSILAGLLQPTSGQVRVFGQDFASQASNLKKALGIVPQELAIYGELTARENLRFFGELYGVRGEKLKRRVGEVLAIIGLEDRADQRASTFSGGMQRRLNLGVALVHRPRLLLLDEPTTGVDPQSRNHIFEEVRQLNAQGMTIIYTSHYMEEVQALCPRVGIIDHGLLVACDTLVNLLRQLPGSIRFRIPGLTSFFLEKLQEIQGVRLWPRAEDSPDLVLECQEVPQALLQLVALLQQEQVELTHLETEEPNLERVFLHLTGRQLRD